VNKEELANNSIKCLDKGFVRLVDFMGDDSAIVQAARVSYGNGTKSYREDRGLIRYLMRNSHTSPFEMVEFKFHVRLPIFVARQWIRHRTANVNEYSGRYSEMTDEFYVPDLIQLRHQSKNNKQGRSEQNLELHHAENVLKKMKQSQKNSYNEYKFYLEEDLARELARINLPLSSYTEWYWKIDLHNLFHFLRLRLDSHAQFEIRIYAEAIAEIIKKIVPISFEAFEDFRLYSKSFSRIELEFLKNIIDKSKLKEKALLDLGLSKREATDIIDFFNE